MRRYRRIRGVIWLDGHFNMSIQVNGTKLYFDVDGPGLMADGPGLREKPTLLLLHGGPGFDHALFKPAFSAFADIAQLIYYDHRGNGRSGGHPAKLILANTTAKVEFEAMFAAFARRGGAEAGQIARDYWTTPNPEHREKFLEVCFPLYRFRPEINPSVNCSILKSALSLHFNGPENEQGRLDFRAAAARCAARPWSSAASIIR